MKRKIILFALALILALALPAFAAEGDIVLGRDAEQSVFFERAFALGDTLYLSGLDALYAWRTGDEALTSYAYDLGGQSLVNQVSAVPFAWGDRLCAFTLASSYDGEAQNFDGAALAELTLGEDGSITGQKLVDVDWDELVEYYDKSAYANRPSDIVVRGDRAFLRHYDSHYSFAVSAVDLNSGRLERLYALDGAYAIAAYRDDKLLVELFNYEDANAPRMAVYDPQTDALQPLAEIQQESGGPLDGLAYDPEADAAYCLVGGEICPLDLETGAIGEGLAEMPLESFSSASAVILPGGRYAFAGRGMAVRSLDPSQRKDVRLKIVDTWYNDCVVSANAAFSNAHGDVSVVISRDDAEANKLVENMMNRDDSVDIYIIQASSAEYDAVHQRGFQLELDGSAAIDDLAQRMYPSLRESLSVNGHMVALPVSIYGYDLGFDEKALEALGLTLADVPDNWSDLLDFLPTLAGPLSENDKVRLVDYDGQTVSGMRSDLLRSMFNCYQRYVGVVDPSMGYDTPLLRALLEKLEAIDFEALGCLPDDEADETGGGSISLGGFGEKRSLLNTYTTCSVDQRYMEHTPLLMGLDADTRPPLVLESAVAFVNPFTRNPEAALAFMDALAGCLPNTVLYGCDPALDEPVRDPDYESNMAEFQETVDQMTAQLETAEPAMRQMLEDQLAEVESYRDMLDKLSWQISRESIDWYRAHAEGVCLAPVNWLYADEDGEASELMSQYTDGRIGADELLKGIDRKAQMMRLEGN